jgi:hypothetical protein
VKLVYLLPPAHGLRGLRENSTPEKHQEIETEVSGTIYVLMTYDTSIQKLYEGSADAARIRY